MEFVRTRWQWNISSLTHIIHLYFVATQLSIPGHRPDKEMRHILPRLCRAWEYYASLFHAVHEGNQAVNPTPQTNHGEC